MIGSIYVVFLIVVVGLLVGKRISEGGPWGEWFFANMPWCALAIVSTIWATIFAVVAHFVVKFW